MLVEGLECAEETFENLAIRRLFGRKGCLMRKGTERVRDIVSATGWRGSLLQDAQNMQQSVQVEAGFGYLGHMISKYVGIL